MYFPFFSCLNIFILSVFIYFLFLSALKKILIVKVFFCFYFFLAFSFKKKFSLFFSFLLQLCFIFFLVNKLFFSFLIWNFLCFLKNISSLVSRFFFPTIFSFLKLVCGFWQIARLQEFFLLLLFHHLLLPGWGTWMDGWRDGWRDGWMERTTTTKLKDII